MNWNEKMEVATWLRRPLYPSGIWWRIVNSIATSYLLFGELIDKG